MSVLDFLHLGSSLALRGVGRFGSGISVQERVALGSGNTYFHYDKTAEQVEWWVDGVRTMTMLKESDTGAGNLHGVWFSDGVVHTSDRRLKRNIEPLAKIL